MKTALVCALILGSAMIGSSTGLAAGPQCYMGGKAYAVATHRVGSRYPAPVAEMTTGCGPRVEGLLLRVSTAPQPAQMINPAAPAIYGSGRSLVTYEETQVHRDANPNVRRLHSDGLRLWSLKDFW